MFDNLGGAFAYPIAVFVPAFTGSPPPPSPVPPTAGAALDDFCHNHDIALWRSAGITGKEFIVTSFNGQIELYAGFNRTLAINAYRQSLGSLPDGPVLEDGPARLVLYEPDKEVSLWCIPLGKYALFNQAEQKMSGDISSRELAIETYRKAIGCFEWSKS